MRLLNRLNCHHHHHHTPTPTHPHFRESWVPGFLHSEREVEGKLAGGGGGLCFLCACVCFFFLVIFFVCFSRFVNVFLCFLSKGGGGLEGGGTKIHQFHKWHGGLDGVRAQNTKPPSKELLTCTIPLGTESLLGQSQPLQGMVKILDRHSCREKAG